MSIVNKRLLREIKSLLENQNTKPLLDNDYLVLLNEENSNLVHTIMKAPTDSVYKHTFIRLDFEIPSDYPHSPPKVFFINHDNVRIHPNMYEDGKVCATILGTWPSDNEKWTSSMGIETTILALMSFFDNNPYTHEPGGRDNPTYTTYVRYQSFITCLIRYLQKEPIYEFKYYIQEYMLSYIDQIFLELDRLHSLYPPNYYYTPCFEIDNFHVNYSLLSYKLQELLEDILFEQPLEPLDDSTLSTQSVLNEMEMRMEVTNGPESNNYITPSSSFQEMDSLDYFMAQIHTNDTTTQTPIPTPKQIDNTTNEVVQNTHDNSSQKEYKCCICFDTESNGPVDKLNCNHTFHRRCISIHIEKNSRVCPLCRQYIVSFSHTKYKKTDTWVINPKTQKRIKVGGKTHHSLVDEGILKLDDLSYVNYTEQVLVNQQSNYLESDIEPSDTDTIMDIEDE
jgi:ubiquitin-protein ligase